MNEPMQSLLELQTLEFGARQDESTSAAITKLRGKIPLQILGHYDRLRVRGKKGIVPVQNQVCTGCHMRLPLAVVMTLKHEEDIQLCDTCGRYLYLPSEAAIPTAATPLVAESAPVARVRRKTRPARVRA
jgi:predicted  nucleic acid-binding Zn-ribbon protein